jgi:hypothetical protein
MCVRGLHCYEVKVPMICPATQGWMLFHLLSKERAGKRPRVLINDGFWHPRVAGTSEILS